MFLKSLKIAAQSALLPDTFRKAPQMDFLFCAPDRQRQDLISGKYFDRILDPLISDLRAEGYRVELLALPFALAVGSRCWNFSYSCNRYFLVKRLLSLFNPRVSAGSARKQIYGFILSRMRPKCVIGIHLPSELIEAAKEICISSAEVLHGFGYADLDMTHRAPQQVPDAVVSFDSFSTNTLLKRHKEDLKIYTLGIKRNTDFVNRVIQTEAVSESNTRFQVLFSLQWGYSDADKVDPEMPQIPNGLIPESVLEAMTMSENDIDWHFRLHPMQRTSEYSSTRRVFKRLLDKHPNAEWKISSTEPVQSVLTRITHHVSLSSGTAYEAAAAGVPSLMLDYRFQPGFKHGRFLQELRDSRALTVGDYTSSQILNWIRNPENQNFAPIPIEDTDSFLLMAAELLNGFTRPSKT